MTIIKHYWILLTGVPAEHPHPEIPKVPPPLRGFSATCSNIIDKGKFDLVLLFCSDQKKYIKQVFNGNKGQELGKERSDKSDKNLKIVFSS